MKNKVLITGHKGFIGSHLTKELEKKYEVIGIDLKDGKDIRNLTPNDFKGVKYVFHLAAQTKVPFSVDQPLLTNDHNITGTLNVFHCAKEAGVEKVITSSSSSVYGNQDVQPLVEIMTPNPLSPYAVQKLAMELYAKVYFNLFGLPIICLRYFNVYGEGMPIDGAYAACMAIFLDDKAHGRPSTVYGGKQKRDFTYVDDVVRANIMAAESNVDFAILNIGAGNNHSIDEIAETVNDKIVHKPQRKGEPMETLADTSLAKKLLGWEPTGDALLWLMSKSQ